MSAQPSSLDSRLRRAAAYLAKLGPAVEGQDGDAHTFKACKVGILFDIDEGDFLPVLDRWNGTCSPPWDPRALERKLRSTYRNSNAPRGAALERDGERREQAPRVADAPTYPPEREVVWLWDTATPVAYFSNPAPVIPYETPATTWLRSIGIDPAGLGLHPELQMRSQLHASQARDFWPAWAKTGGARWCDTGYGALIPLFDHRGDLRSLKARWTTQAITDEQTGEVVGAPPDGVKSAGPFGFDVRGVVMCNAQALYILKTGAWQDDTPRDQRELWIAEGEPDLAVVTYRLHNSARPMRAAIGIHPGAWTAQIAARVPKDSTVVLASDPDKAGDKLAEVVQRTLQGRATIKRFDARKLQR